MTLRFDDVTEMLGSGRPIVRTPHIAVDRDGTNGPTIPDASSDRLFDKKEKTFDCLLHSRVSRNVIPQSLLAAEFQLRAPL